MVVHHHVVGPKVLLELVASHELVRVLEEVQDLKRMAGQLLPHPRLAQFSTFELGLKYSELGATFWEGSPREKVLASLARLGITVPTKP